MVCGDKLNNKKISCGGCENLYCGDCYIETYENGAGVISCNYCNYTIGFKQDAFSVFMGAYQIKERLKKL